MGASLSKLVSFAATHVNAEGKTGIEDLLATLEADPIYDLYPIAKRFSGMTKTRRYFQHFRTEVNPRIEGSTLRSEAIGTEGLSREYDVKVVLPGAETASIHRIFSILTFGQERLSGGRLYTDEKMLRLLIGPLWNSLEPIPTV